MYLQITTQCNMKCAHCLYSCEPEKGKHIPLSVARKAIILSQDYDEFIVIGGGEPTLHPYLLDILGLTCLLQVHKDYCPLMITNGTCNKSLWNILLKAYKNKNIDLHVSTDIWHDKKLQKDFILKDVNLYKLGWGGVQDSKIRTITNKGRATKNLDRLTIEAKNVYQEIRIEDTDCEDYIVTPEGRVVTDLIEYKDHGPLSMKAIDKALEAIQEYQEKSCVAQN